jgi:hypothetical protein
MLYSIPRLSRKDASIYAYFTLGREPSLYLYIITVYRISVYSRSKDLGMISSVHKVVYISRST